MCYWRETLPGYTSYHLVACASQIAGVFPGRRPLLTCAAASNSIPLPSISDRDYRATGSGGLQNDMNSCNRKSRCSRIFVVTVLVLFSTPALLAQENLDKCQGSSTGLTLSGNARDWQFLDAVGPHSALLGRENGSVEAWVFPLKLFRNFHLTFRAGDHVIAAESLPRTITIRPESTAIRYIADTFSVCELWFTPLNEGGAVITLEVESAEPLQTLVSFEPDLAWMWPAGMGAAYSEWLPKMKAFRFGEEEHRFYALAGSPEGKNVQQAYAMNYASSQSDVLDFGPAITGNATYHFAVAASFEGQKQAEDLYQKLLAQAPQLEQQARQYYEHYLLSTLRLALPDRDLQAAYDWARISTLQGLVDDPFAGKGLIAGYNISGNNHRPGFAWFFGRDSMWTALALDSIGDFQTTRTALEFLEKYQREDGRVPHEIPQSVGLVNDWFKAYGYGFASADATPLYVIAADDYIRASGDTAFARAQWDSLWRAYQFLHSTYGATGLPRNQGVGHGWIEGGPLLPVSTELYQAGVGAECLRALADVARLVGKADVADSLMSEFAAQRTKIESAFWSPEKNTYVYALDVNGKRIDRPSVLGTVAMWFGLLSQPRGESFLNTLASPDHQADWGMRIISQHDPLYGPAGYHYGSVWPLFTGWESVAAYRYHRNMPGYLNLRANAQLVFDGTLGRATEVLSGRYYAQLTTSTPHQIWSSAMIVSPILRGMMGLSVDAVTSTVNFEPHVPANWTSFAVENIPVGESSGAGTTTLTLSYQRKAGEIILQIQRHGGQRVQLEFSPAFSLRAKLLSADVNGNAVAVHPAEPPNALDQHLRVSVPLTEDTSTVRIRFRDDFGIVYPYQPPANGAVSTSLKVVSEQWNDSHDRLELQLAGAAGKTYEIPLAGDLAGVTATGADLDRHSSVLKLTYPSGQPNVFTTRAVLLQFPKR